MVQRKVPNKLDIQNNHAKTQKLWVNPKPSSLQHHNTKKTTKMKTKKSGLISPRSQKPPSLPLALARPNYMKPTTSSDARKLGLASSKNKATKTLARMTSLKMMKTPSFKPARTSMKKRSPSAAGLHENLDAKRATCSATLKECKFPAYLKLNPGGTESKGTSTVKVCQYSYCSLNGHCRASLSPLKCFLSARRRAFKTQRSVKMVCLSPRPIGSHPSFDEKPQEEHIDFFVEIYETKKKNAAENHDEKVVEMVPHGLVRYEVDSLEILGRTGDRNATEVAGELSSPCLAQEADFESSDMDWEISHCTPLYLDDDDDYEYTSQMEKKQDIIGADVIIETDDKLSYCVDEIPKDAVSQESFDEMSLKSDYTWSSSEGHEVQTEDHLSDEFQANDIQNLDNIVKECNQAGNFETGQRPMDHADKSHSEFSNLNSAGNSCLTRAKGKCKKPITDSDETGHFNPGAPNFLSVDPEPEAEKVDLRHQEPDERKNAEEWMVDYALRQAVTRLAPFKNRKVALLVEAFEKVMPTMRVQLQQGNSSVFHHARPIQACS